MFEIKPLNCDFFTVKIVAVIVIEMHCSTSLQQNIQTITF